MSRYSLLVGVDTLANWKLKLLLRTLHIILRSMQKEATCKKFSSLVQAACEASRDLEPTDLVCAIPATPGIMMHAVDRCRSDKSAYRHASLTERRHVGALQEEALQSTKTLAMHSHSGILSGQTDHLHCQVSGSLLDLQCSTTLIPLQHSCTSFEIAIARQ